jgi:hypothetical protein
MLSTLDVVTGTHRRLLAGSLALLHVKVLRETRADVSFVISNRSRSPANRWLDTSGLAPPLPGRGRNRGMFDAPYLSGRMSVRTHLYGCTAIHCSWSSAGDHKTRTERMACDTLRYAMRCPAVTDEGFSFSDPRARDQLGDVRCHATRASPSSVISPLRISRRLPASPSN